MLHFIVTILMNVTKAYIIFNTVMVVAWMLIECARVLEYSHLVEVIGSHV